MSKDNRTYLDFDDKGEFIAWAAAKTRALHARQAAEKPAFSRTPTLPPTEFDRDGNPRR